MDIADFPSITLNDGQALPAIGFGTYPLSGRDGCHAVVTALRQGYRLIDSAQNYDNEATVGEAIRRSGVPREEIAVTTKLAGRHHRADLARRAIAESLWRFGLDRLDLLLIHWPNPRRGLYVEAWQALVEAKREGLVRSIGVSNFTEEHLARLIEATGVVPAVNQVELHPYLPQADLRAAHARLGIVTEAWSPLGRLLIPQDAEPIAAAARRLNVSFQQVILRWHVQLGVIALPKAADPDRQRANLDVFNFELEEAEMAAISALADGAGVRVFGFHPDEHEEL
ncbi:MAG: aldo/keto reductase [Propionibacteriaceae bacterium]|jgi:diketogulonate reductase-like aldo/keto reductase|nr:aldo/keto reductase [Propionibacteriaceae bacterium]